jgi:pantothenate kinase-related protein Tda10
MKAKLLEQLLSFNEEKNRMFITFEGPEGGGKSTPALC